MATAAVEADLGELEIPYIIVTELPRHASYLLSLENCLYMEFAKEILNPKSIILKSTSTLAQLRKSAIRSLINRTR